MVDVHSSEVDEVVIPALVDALRTENPYSRAAIQKVLVGLQQADFPAALPPTNLSAWPPSKDDTPLDIDSNARKWLKWWNDGKPVPAPVTPAPAK